MPPPLYEIEVVLTITNEDNGSVVGNEKGDDSNDENDDDARRDEDLDPHWLLAEEKIIGDDNFLSKDETDRTVVLLTAKRNTWY